MWKIIPNSSHVSEPEVLRNLKVLLAKTTCNCDICNGHEKPLLIQYKNKQIQVKDQDLFDMVGQVSSTIKLHPLQNLQKNLFCPGCYVAMNLCREKDLKFLKDEESETKTEMFSRDKSTEKEILVVEKSTSHTNRTEYKNAMVSRSEDFFDYSVEPPTKTDNQNSRKEAATLLDCQQGTLETMPVDSNCLCMANFINSIRPPLPNNDIFDM